MISFDDALECIARAAIPLDSERIALSDAAGRTLADPVAANIDGPRADLSTMDGYAVREADVSVLPAMLRIANRVYPGREIEQTIGSGTCVRIFTGAPIPFGADRVVMQEDVEERDGLALIQGGIGDERHIRRRASDFATGDRLVEAGQRLGPRQLVAIAGGDVDTVSVARQAGVAIIGTGDELTSPGKASQTPLSIPESLAVGLAALVEREGGRVIHSCALPDDLAHMQRAAAQLPACVDLVIVTGGASVGVRDFARQMFAASGLDLLFSTVAMKPGKPVWLGRTAERLVLGLPGNPTSALVTARLLLVPLLAGLAGRPVATAFHWRRSRATEQLPATGNRETFLRARSGPDGIHVLSNQDSGAQRALADADALVRRRANSPVLAAGASVDILDF